MSNFPHAIAIIIPAAYKPAFEKLGADLGHSGQEYNIPLAADPAATVATHWGVNSKAQAAFVAILNGTTKPPGVSQADYNALRAVMDYRIVPEAQYAGNFHTLRESVGLHKIALPESE